jgi:cysteinyl-tRNA synthetase
MHNAFMSINSEKISKSLGNTFTLDDVAHKGVSPLALRYLFLQAHYRTPLSFTWEALAAAHEAHARLSRQARAIREAAKHSKASAAQAKFAELMRDDLSTAAALALVHESLRDESLSAAEKLGVIEAAERYFGLSLLAKEAPVPAEVRALADAREEARKNKDFAASDEYRIHIEARGYRVDDTPSGTVLTKINR